MFFISTCVYIYIFCAVYISTLKVLLEFNSWRIYQSMSSIKVSDGTWNFWPLFKILEKKTNNRYMESSPTVINIEIKFDTKVCIYKLPCLRFLVLVQTVLSPKKKNVQIISSHEKMYTSFSISNLFNLSIWMKLNSNENTFDVLIFNCLCLKLSKSPHYPMFNWVLSKKKKKKHVREKQREIHSSLDRHFLTEPLCSNLSLTDSSSP